MLARPTVNGNSQRAIIIIIANEWISCARWRVRYCHGNIKLMPTHVAAPLRRHAAATSREPSPLLYPLKTAVYSVVNRMHCDTTVGDGIPLRLSVKQLLYILLLPTARPCQQQAMLQRLSQALQLQRFYFFWCHLCTSGVAASVQLFMWACCKCTGRFIC